MEWRIDQLDRLERMLNEHEADFQKAIAKDFKTSFAEQLFETRATIGTIQITRSQLKSWMEPTLAPLPKFFAETGHTVVKL